MSIQNPNATLSTGDLARKTGTTLRTVRFYEEAGLLEPSAIGKGGRRLYTDADLEKLSLIADLRELDLSLEEIRQLLEVRTGCCTAPELAERFGSILHEQLERASKRLAALVRLRDEFSAALRTLGSCRTCDSHFHDRSCTACDLVKKEETPRIIKILVGGADGAAKDEQPPG